MLIRSVPITLDKPRSLRYTLNAIVEIEERAGVAFDVFLSRFSQPGVSPRFADVRLVLWAGLIHEDEGLTEQAVGAMLDIHSVTDVLMPVFNAFAAAQPEAKEDSRPPLTAPLSPSSGAVYGHGRASEELETVSSGG